MPYSDLEDEAETKTVKVSVIVILAIILAVAFFLSSCTIGYATSPDGSKTFVGAVGGKGAAKSKQLALNYDNEKSFSDGALVAGIAIGAYQAVASQRSADAVSKAADANRSAEAINASNNAVKTAEINAGVTKATTLNPNIVR